MEFFKNKSPFIKALAVALMIAMSAVLVGAGSVALARISNPSAAGSTALDDLSDVTITSAAYGDVLMYAGSAWADTATSTLFGQNLTAVGSPTFAGITVTGLSGAVSASGGVLSAGTLSVANGGTGTTTQQANKVYFGDGDSFEQAQFLSVDQTNGRLGISSSTPAYKLSIGTRGTTYGTIATVENAIATSTSITVDARNGNQQLIQMGTSATTISFSNFAPGVTVRLMVCNPGASAGAITWSGVRYFGTAPTQTTTANKCDMYVVGATAATTTGATGSLLWLAQGGAGL